MTPSRLLASGFGTGFSPIAPGTAGSLAGLAVAAACLQVSPWLLALVTILCAAAGTLAIRAATGLAWNETASPQPIDPGWIVIDEIAGQCLTLLPLTTLSWSGLAIGFALFRLFDIAKPGPIGWIDKKCGAVWIMADDIAAALPAALILAALRAAWPSAFAA
jgi:phosphatidylglycerophosphatase A